MTWLAAVLFACFTVMFIRKRKRWETVLMAIATVLMLSAAIINVVFV